jgi:hypothetical protein
MKSVLRLFSPFLVVGLIGVVLVSSTQLSSEVIDVEVQRGGIAGLCSFTHREAVDPIRFAEGGHESHLHDFFGVRNVQPSMSVEYLLKQDNTCTAFGDRSSYWVPTLFEDGKEVTPSAMAVYITVPDGVNSNSVVLPPNGLEMITVKSSWKCSRQGISLAVPQQCPENSDTRLRLEFPYCWDGRGTVFQALSPHVVLSDSKCPTSHSVVLPQIVLEIRYKIVSIDAVSFSSGDLTSVHGDVLFAWNQISLERDFDACLRRNLMCGVTWSTELGV